MYPALHLLWAKSNPFMSLWTHSVCAGICTEVFLSSKSSAAILRYLSEELQESCEKTIQLVSYLASVHDIGKAHPAFQSKDKDRMNLLKAGLPDAFSANKMEIPVSSFRHEHYSAKVLRQIWKTKGYDRTVICEFASVISLHHQKPKDQHSLVDPVNKNWAAWQKELEDAMNHRFLKEAVFRKPIHTDAACMLISSLIILMDWVSSSELFRCAESMPESAIRDHASHVMQLYGLIDDHIFPRITDFQELFPGIANPRPLQAACAGLNDQAPLTIIEAPMGEGKTEAALYIGSRICGNSGRRGIYMALPSQATSNQMHIRFGELLSHLDYGGARLLHGTAFLQENIPDAFVSEDEAIAAKWIRPSRMGLLGANAVGTVDQAMAAVLKTKFSLIRLAGLSNKILIIDEIHAYDMYMSQIIETLLRWCHDMEIPVILLSATMQMAQKQRYLSCFKADLSGGVSGAYPLITQALPDHQLREIPVDASSHYQYIFEPARMEYDAARIAAEAIASIKDEGCIAVMVNTVKHAQEIFRALNAEKDSGAEILLFHSRFPLNRRSEIEKRCVSLFGKDRSNRPQKAVLVATQVVEQSIDLDFDGMFSELAPIDLLLQRAGRLHRHRENSRPLSLQEPIVKVIMPQDSESVNLDKRYGPSGYVYDPFLLFNTEKLLSESRVVRVPEDIRGIVEEAYSTVTVENREAWIKRSFQELLETAQAKGNVWPMPEGDTFFPAETTVYYNPMDSDDGFESSSEASTRLGDSGIRIAFCDEESFDRYAQADIPYAEQIDIYLNSVQVRLKGSDLRDSHKAMEVQHGKLSGIWLLRGKKQVDLISHTIYNDPKLGVYWEVK